MVAALGRGIVFACFVLSTTALSVQREHGIFSDMFLRMREDYHTIESKPHRAPRSKFSNKERNQIIQNIQDFIKSSPEGFATIVLMGDSTMSGITTELLNITSAAPGEDGCIYELVYVSNDRARAVNYGCNRGCGGVPPGGEWILKEALTDDMARKTALRAQASTKALHDDGCKSGGGLETYLFRTGPFKGLVVHHWGFLPEYTDFCWDNCMTNAMAALKPQAVLWNIGLHLLNHDFKPSVCAVRKNPTKKNCGNYKEMVKLATTSMVNSGIPHVIWKSTNWLCEDIQSEGFPLTKAALDKWHVEENRPNLNQQCLQDCPAYKDLDLPCYEWFMDAHTSTRMYHESESALEDLHAELEDGNSVSRLDAYAVTKECCDGDCHKETDDGEHYTGLDAGLVKTLAQTLGERVR